MTTSSSDQDDSSKIACSDLMNRFAYCSSPRVQFHYYREHGDFDDCSVYFSDFLICLQYTITIKPDTKQRLHRRMITPNRPKIINDVWDYKKKPCWGDESQDSIKSNT